MHESSVVSGLMRKIALLAREHDAEHVVGIRVRLGALSHFTPDHFREHFEDAARGTVAEGALVEVLQEDDIYDPNAQDVILDTVDLV